MNGAEKPDLSGPSTINAAILSGAGHAAATGAISAEVAALAQGVVRTMLLTKLKIASPVLLIVSAAGVDLLTFRGQLS